MDNTNILVQQGSGRPVADVSTYCEGDVEPRLNKKIQILVERTRNYIVYVDDDDYVEWCVAQFDWSSPAGFDDVANRIGHLETMSVTQLLPSQRQPFARLLAEAMARTLGGCDNGKADEVLDKAEKYLTARGIENARRWYLQGAGIICLCALGIAGALVLVRTRTTSPEWETFLEVGTGAAVGSLGALLSIANRTESIHLEPVAGPSIHRFEGIVRILAGMAGGFFVALGIKADLLLGVFHSLSHPFLALIAASMVSGAGERLVPGLIKRMGETVNDKP